MKSTVKKFVITGLLALALLTPTSNILADPIGPPQPPTAGDPAGSTQAPISSQMAAINEILRRVGLSEQQRHELIMALLGLFG